MIQHFKSEKPFHLESGETIEELLLAYNTFGTRKEDDSNIIWVFHALTANSDVSEWWPALFGKGQILDPEKYFIICVNVIGSPYGSSCPTALDFPLFSVRDICKAFSLLARSLKINKIFLCIGGSFGGDQALEFAYSFPGQIEHLILIASCAKESAWAIAVHETQRLALKSDPTFGKENGGQEGIKAARAIGMLTYRTSKLFIDKQTDDEGKLDDFLASSYIRYQGEKFADRFSALSYYYLTKCLDSHDVGRGRGGVAAALGKINTPTLIISIESDMLIPPMLQQEIYDGLPNATLKSISSDAGHDGFLIEGDKIRACIEPFINRKSKPRNIFKFGGKSLANGEPIEGMLNIIEAEHTKSPLAIVVSARGETTDQLLEIYEEAISGHPYQDKLQALLAYQSNDTTVNLADLAKELTQLVDACAILQVPNKQIRNKILAYGELMSAKAISSWLKEKSINSRFVDSRKILKTKFDRGEEQVDQNVSRDLCNKLFDGMDSHTIPIITGFIAEDENGLTTNLGRNGSNYSASLIAAYTRAKAMYNWTDVDGIFSANPKYVKDARLIEHLNFKEANEMANFGTKILHSKTILPLIENRIPLFIKNSFKPGAKGTRVDHEGSDSGIKAVSAIEDISLIAIEGAGLLGKVGIDSRIFTCLHRNHISVRLISQASTERGIGFVIDRSHSKLALKALHEEFEDELFNKSVSTIKGRDNVAIIAITGRHNYALEKAIQGLRKNKIWIHLFSNSINGENISLVIDNKRLITALNIVHEYVV